MPHDGQVMTETPIIPDLQVLTNLAPVAKSQL